MIFNDIISWSSLKLTVNLIDTKSFHYKSISRIHRLWSKKGVYEQVFKEIYLNDPNIFKSDDKIY